VVKVYPGFNPGFTVTGTCFLNNYIFSDTSKTKYGAISSRLWDFGDATTLKDTATLKRYRLEISCCRFYTGKIDRSK
jgi:PKD repeat protein